MRLFFIQTVVAAAAAGLLCAQNGKPPALNEPQGIPPRSAPTDYQAQGKAGAVTIAAEFAGHAVPTPDGPLNTDDYVVVEVGLFGADKLVLSPDDFSLRVNGKKAAVQSRPYGAVVASVKDPEWAPPEKKDKPKTSIGSGGAGAGPGDDGPPPPVKVPIEVQRAIAQRVRKVSLWEGDRPLPQAGLLYFPYHGKTKGISSLELIYSGPAGTATLVLQP